MTTLQQLQSTLEGYRSQHNGTLVLGQETLGSSSVQNLLSYATGSPSLTLIQVQPIQLNGDTIPIIGRATLFEVTAANVSGNFKIVSDIVAFTLTIQLSDEWTFKVSFPDVDSSKPLLAEKCWTNPKLILSNYYYNDLNLKAEIFPGVNFAAQTSFQQLKISQDWLITQDSPLNICGTLDLGSGTTDSPKLTNIDLNAPLAVDFQLGSLRLDDFHVNLGLASYTSVQTGSPLEQSFWYLVGGTFTIEENAVDIRAIFPDEQSNFMEFVASGDIPVSSLFALSNLLGIDDLTQSLPKELKDTLSQVALTSLRFGFDPTSTEKVQYISFSIESTQPWHIFSWFEIEQIGIDFMMVEPLVKSNCQISGLISGSVSIGSVDWQVAAKMPDWDIAAWVPSEQKLDITNLYLWFQNTFEFPLPPLLSEVDVQALSLSYRTRTKDFMLTSTWKFGESAKVTLGFAAVSQGNGSFAREAKGVLVFNEGKANKLDFETILVSKQSQLELVAAYQGEATKSIKLKDIVAAIDTSEVNFIPDVLEVDLLDALFAYRKVGNSSSKFLMGLDMGGGINLSNLPVVGKEFSSEQTTKLAYQILFTSELFAQNEVGDLIALLGNNRPTTLSNQAITKGLSFQASLRLGNDTQALNLPVQLDPSSGQVVATNSGQQTASNAQWFTLQKSFGPVHFQRVGLQYQQNELWLLLDASLSVSALTLSLQGLSVSSPLTELNPSFHLQGLGLDYKKDPLEIGGAFLRKQVNRNGQIYDEYDGIAILQTELKGKNLGIHAIGSYTYYNDDPSLFLYAVLDYPIGGPPFFFIEGLAAGFGYNRSLSVPPIEQIAQFPLVAEAISGSMPDIAQASNQAQIIEQELNKLNRYIQPDVGALFFAVGIKFNSFKMIDCFALVTLAVGDRFELDLLGVADLKIPFGEDDVSPLAEARMLQKASFIPSEGFFGIRAQLDSSSSFILSRDCHLTGGYAFYTWFAGEHEGDFVITLGGYHPNFQVPPHYPKVPRLGINWQVDSHLLIKGSCYFALCAHALMAGGYEEASYRCGHAHASFRAGVDFLICWKPFHYDIGIRVEVSAGYGALSASLGVDLQIWGPDFGGYAKIKVILFSFKIRFGDQSSRYPSPIDWSTFKSSFLPADDSICSISATTGLVRQLKQNDETLWVVNPKQFSFVVDAFIPTKQAFRGPSNNPLDGGNACQEFGIRPMAVQLDDLQTTQRLEITYGEKRTHVEDRFNFEPLQKKAPSALWAKPNLASSNPERLQPPEVNEQQFVVANTGASPLSGFQITPAKPPTPGITDDIDTQKLQYTTYSIRDAYTWEVIPPFVASTSDDTTRRNTIRNSIASNSLRNQMLQALGFDLSQDVQLDPEALADAFVIAPQVR